jgi:hypothetical protein
MSLFIYMRHGVTMFYLVDALLRDLAFDFALKYLGNLHYFLGIQVLRCQDGGLLSCQEKYAMDLLENVGMRKLQGSSDSYIHIEQGVD